MHKMIRLVTFDVTGTLLRVQASVGEQYGAAILKCLDTHCDAETLNNSFPKSYNIHSNAYPMFGRSLGITSKQWWLSVFLETLMHAGIISSAHRSVSKDLSLSNFPLWAINENNSSLQRAFEHVYYDFKWETTYFSSTFLKYLKEHNRGISTGIITNNDERVTDALKKTGLHSYIDFVVTSAECGYQKPDRHIFEAAIECASQLSHPSKKLPAICALHIGDSLEKDYFGSINAGYNALILDPSNEHRNGGKVNPEHCVKDLSVALKMFKKMNTS